MTSQRSGALLLHRVTERARASFRDDIESAELKPIKTFHYSLGENSSGSRARCPMGNHG